MASFNIYQTDLCCNNLTIPEAKTEVTINRVDLGTISSASQHLPQLIPYSTSGLGPVSATGHYDFVYYSLNFDVPDTIQVSPTGVTPVDLYFSSEPIDSTHSQVGDRIILLFNTTQTTNAVIRFPQRGGRPPHNDNNNLAPWQSDNSSGKWTNNPPNPYILYPRTIYLTQGGWPRKVFNWGLRKKVYQDAYYCYNRLALDLIYDGEMWVCSSDNI